METLRFVLVMLVGSGAAFVQRVSGFGLGIFAMLFLPHFMPSHTDAATISCLFSCITSTYNAVKYRKQIPFKTTLPLICSAMVTIPIAVYFSANISGEFFEMLLGLVLIVLSVYFLFFDYHIRIKATTVNGIIAGSLGGTLNGLFSTGGPPVVLYLSKVTNDNALYFAAIQFYFCIANIYATGFRAINGLVTGQLLVYAAIGFVGCLLGDLLGHKVFDRIDTKTLKKIIYIGMIISGVLMLV